MHLERRIHNVGAVQDISGFRALASSYRDLKGCGLHSPHLLAGFGLKRIAACTPPVLLMYHLRNLCLHSNKFRYFNTKK